MNRHIPIRKIKNIPKAFLIGCGFLLVFIFICFATSTILDNDVEVKQNSDLTYYLNVNYDGVDKQGITSSDKATAEIKSGYIHVEDKIPTGLIFNGFITTEDGSIGAVSRNNGSVCSGKVVDDTDGTETLTSYHGLHYDELTRTVSFDVKDLKAGCVLTVGIKTITPTIDDPTTPERERRRDFYNFATFNEDQQSGKSNTVHVWMGKEDLTMYKVSYEYEGVVPKNAPNAPEPMEYVSNTSVGVASNVNVEGYEFSGWTTTDVEVENSNFKMPEKNVVFKGSFKEIPKYSVKYEISGIKPDGYITPTTKEYYPNSTVTLDSLKTGEVFNGYRFLGWTTTDIENLEDAFTMPEKDVTIIGQFEEVTYTVTYKYYETVIPHDIDGNPINPPEQEIHKPGETVSLPKISDLDGYTFLGWYKDDNFTMPEENVIIYGEWKEKVGYFEPIITKEIINPKTYYQPVDTVKYKIIVTNTAAFPIKDVIIAENNENSSFILGSGYEVVSPHNIRIEEIGAGLSITAFAEYKVTKKDKGTIKNEVQITGALASNNYLLNPELEYKATSEFKVKSKITVCKNVNKIRNQDDKFQISIKNKDYESWIILKNNECKNIYVEPGSYKIGEVVGQDYIIDSVIGSITNNNELLNVAFDKTYKITFINEYKSNFFFHSAGRAENKIIKAYNFA